MLGITFANGKVIGEIEGDGYKYLRVIERSDICQEQMKRSVQNEYFKRVRSAQKSNAGFVFQAINIWAVPTVRCGAEVTKWTKEELKQMDRKTRKLITIFGGLHPRSRVDRFYIPKRDEGSIW